MKNYLSKLLMALSITLCLCSCTTTYIASKYNISATAEVPENVTVKYSDTKVERLHETDSLMTFNYEDDLVKITWSLSDYYYYLTLVNKTDQTIKINWDDIVYITPSGLACKMIHKGIDLRDYSLSQVSTVIPRGSRYEDRLLPTSAIFSEIDDGITKYYINKSYFFSPAKRHDKEKITSQNGTTATIHLPIIINDVQNNYLFHFTIDDVSATQEKVFSLAKTLGLVCPIGSLAIACLISILVAP